MPVGLRDEIVKAVEKQTLLDRIRRGHQSTQLITFHEKSMITARVLAVIG